MRARTRRAGLAVAGLALGLTATATHATTFVPNTPLTQVFLACDGPSKEYVVGSFVNGDAGTPTWTTTAPASVTTGAGCGKADEPVFNGTRPRTPFQLTFEGSYTGNLDVLTVDLYTADYGPARANGALTLAVRATVDDKSLFGVANNTSSTGVVVPSPGESKVTVTPVATGSTGQVRKLTFSITGIDLMLQGDDRNHTILLDVRDTTPTAPNGHTWLWGAAEAPSGLVFTPAKVDATTALQAGPRDQRVTVG